MHDVFAVLKGSEKLGLLHRYGCVSPRTPVWRAFLELPGQSGVSWLGDTRDRVRTGRASHTLDLLHSG